MAFPERFSNLPDYAFPRLRKLLDHLTPGGDPVAMTIGEPKHAMPDFVGPVLAANLVGSGSIRRMTARQSCWTTSRPGCSAAMAWRWDKSG